MAHYKSTIKLYDAWNKRFQTRKMLPELKAMTDAARAAMEAEKNARLKPLEQDE
jgi:hypothetical protein